MSAYPDGLSQSSFDRAFDELGPEDDSDFSLAEQLADEDDNDTGRFDADDTDEYIDRPLTRAEFEDYDYWRDTQGAIIIESQINIRLRQK